VGVSKGAGVGGGSTIGSRALVERVTFSAYTQPSPRGPLGNSICIHSPAGLRPIAGAVPPDGSEPMIG
jgi:hypothetical protein